MLAGWLYAAPAAAFEGQHQARPAVKQGSKRTLTEGQRRFRQLRRRFRALARDPAHNNKITPCSREEAYVGLRLESLGQLPGMIKREPSGSAEFIDGAGVRWDVKAFNSHFPPQKGGFVLERALAKVASQFQSGEQVILDTRNLFPQHLKNLKRGIAKRGWSSKVLWFPSPSTFTVPSI